MRFANECDERCTARGMQNSRFWLRDFRRTADDIHVLGSMTLLSAVDQYRANDHVPAESQTRVSPMQLNLQSAD